MCSPKAEPISVEGVAGSPVNLTVPGAALVSFSDPQGALQGATLDGNSITGLLSTNLGQHRVFARVIIGGLPQTRIFNVRTLDIPGQPATSFGSVPSGATWATVNMSGQLATNITTIYQQLYLSPRPLTISSRVGTDGYSPWTFPHWGLTKPTIATGNVAGLLVADQLEPAGDAPGRAVPLGRQHQRRLRLALGQLARSGHGAGESECGSRVVPHLRLDHHHAEPDRQRGLAPEIHRWRRGPARAGSALQLLESLADLRQEQHRSIRREGLHGKPPRRSWCRNRGR